MDESTGDALARGARHFDAGAFFEAHEAWEDGWRAAPDEAERRFLQGLVQVAAAFHKVFVMRNPESAARLLAKGLSKLAACPERVAAADLEAFVQGVAACADALAVDRLSRADVPRCAAMVSSPD